MPAQREEDEAKIRQQVDKIVEGIQAKDLEGLKRVMMWHSGTLSAGSAAR